MSDNVRACMVDAYRMRETLSASTLIAIQNDIKAGLTACKVILGLKDTNPATADYYKQELAFYQLLEEGFIKEYQ